jgi:hypothetical protein
MFWLCDQRVGNHINQTEEPRGCIPVVCHVILTRMNGVISNDTNDIQRLLYPYIKAVFDKSGYISIDVPARFSEVFA